MELIEKMARALCSAGSEEVGLCFRDDDPHEYECVKSCVTCRNVARSIATALIEHAGGDGVTEGDRDAAARLNGYANWSVWQAAPQHDAEWMELCAHDFARHRATAFAAGKAAREREIVKEVERELALTSLANIENASADWIAGFEHAQRRAMAAIERGEV